MRGNSAIVKCSIPSFVADFVHVVAWVDEDEVEYVNKNDFNGGTQNKFIDLHPKTPFPFINNNFFI